MFEAYEIKAMELTAGALSLEAVALETKAPADINAALSALYDVSAMHQRAAVAASDHCARVRHEEGYKHLNERRRALRDLGRQRWASRPRG